VAHETQRLHSRIFFILGVGGTELARKRIRRAGDNQQRDNTCYRPLKSGAAKHLQTLTLGDGVDGRSKRFNTF
jgi:hypothetical protein